MKGQKFLQSIIGVSLVSMLLIGCGASYSDEGEFTGRPVYYTEENRITLSLHNELKSCGFKDSDLSKFLQAPFGPEGTVSLETDPETGKVISKTTKSAFGWQIIYYDNDENIVSAVSVAQITSGVYEVKITTCNK